MAVIRRRGQVSASLSGLIIIALVLMLAIGWIGAPGQQLTELVMYLLTAGVLSLGVGVAGVFWLRRGSGRLWLQMTVTYALGIGIALFNVFLTVQLMFISSREFPLLVLLLLFAGVVSLGLGMSLARTIGQRVTALHVGARALAAGDLSARVPVTGRDELSDLAREFNQMAEQLAASATERNRQEAARRDLITAVSHDLRTPLSALRAMVEALVDGIVDDPATVVRYVATMRSQIDHLGVLIDDLFELSQINAGALDLELQRVAIGDLLSDVVIGLQAQATAKSIALEAAIMPDIAPVPVAPRKIERVVYNLIANAIRHTPGGGAVTISAQEVGDGVPAESAATANDWVLIEVADTGEGIGPEDLPHIFDRFYRSEKSRSRATGGSGLGLAIARGIVEAHGGKIWIESAVGQGTCVRFCLPRERR